MLNPRRIALSAAAIAVAAASLLACSDEPERDDSGSVTGAGDADAFSIEVGDCIAEDDAVAVDSQTEVQSVPLVPCEEPHQGEVYASHDIDDSEFDEFPSRDQLDQIEGDVCLPAFEEFIGIPYEESVIEVTFLEPTSRSWDEGDREILCIVVDPTGLTSGTLENSDR